MRSLEPDDADDFVGKNFASAGYRGGRGEPLILIHGAGGTWRQWRPVIPRLEAQHEVIAVNLPGHLGGRPVPNGLDAGIDSLVDDVCRQMTAAGIASAHIVGTSLGGWLALELAKRGRARSAFALAPAGGWRAQTRRLELLRASYRLFGWAAPLMARHPERWSRRRRVRRLLYWHHFAHPERIDPSDCAALLVGLARCEVLPSILAWTRAHSGADGLDQIRCPVMLAFPDKDFVLPRRHFDRSLISQIRDVEVRDLIGAGHMAMFDDPELVAQTILDFVARHRGTARASREV